MVAGNGGDRSSLLARTPRVRRSMLGFRVVSAA
jgi:hypothetical protein